MIKEDLYNKISGVTTNEVVECITNSTNMSDASLKLFGLKSTLGRTVIKELCSKYGLDIPHKEKKQYYCLCCGEEILSKESHKMKFCSHSCAAKFNNRQRRKNKNCLKCGRKLIKGQKKFCSKSCAFEYHYDEFITKWKNGEINGTIGDYGITRRIIRYLRNKYNNSCQLCGWSEINAVTNKVPLTIHHIDGDCTNNAESNLQLLCPNCHSLTENYGALNKKSRRVDKHKH